MSRIAILILGMHRSGTSALARLVGALGAALPADAIEASADNSRGYFESAALVKAHDQVLRVARSSWFDPRPLDLSRLSPDALRSRRARIGEAVAAAFGDAPLIVVKDPRQCRFVPLAVEALGEAGIASRAVLMLRPAAEVAASIARRDGTTAAYAHLLWLRHMLDAERDSRGLMRAVTSYDALLADWRGAAARVAPLLGREGWAPDAETAAAIEGFLDPALRTHRAEVPEPLEESLRGIVAAAEAALARLYERDDADARAMLDAVAARLDAVPWLVEDLIHDELRHRRMPAIEEDVAPAPEPAAPAPPPPVVHDPGSDADLIAGSGLFDEAWYRETYPDVAASGLDPIAHYLAIGAAEGRNPSPLFDTGYYARQMVRRAAGAGRNSA